MRLSYLTIWVLGISSLTLARAGRGRKKLNRRRNNDNRHGLASAPSREELEWCPQCEISNCPVVLESTCSGLVKLDLCNCCPICTGQVIGTPQSQNPGDTSLLASSEGLAYEAPQNQSEACGQIKCPKYQVCMLNIQGIPMCRCPTKFWCMKGDKSPVCGENDVTYKSKCFLKMAECEGGKGIKMKHKGKCFKSDRDRKMKEERMRKKEEKKKGREEKRKKKQDEQEKKKKKKQKLKKREKKRQKREKRRWRRHRKMYSTNTRRFI